MLRRHTVILDGEDITEYVVRGEFIAPDRNTSPYPPPKLVIPYSEILLELVDGSEVRTNTSVCKVTTHF